MLTDKEKIRYSRQMMLSDIAQEGQHRLKKSTALVIGVGGLGSPAALYLAASGVGRIILVDHDVVELSNLQRQIVFKVSHLGQKKVTAAAKTLAALNNQISIETISTGFDEDNAEVLCQQADVILDCSDNFDTRYLVNQSAREARVPLISGAAMAQHGQLCVIDNRQPSNPCYACLFPPSNERTVQNCSTIGVLSPILGMIGSMQASAAINYLASDHLESQFINLDGKHFTQQSFALSKNPNCKVCHNQ